MDLNTNRGNKMAANLPLDDESMTASFSSNGGGKSLTRLLKENNCLTELLPYERFLKYGPETLTDSELLAVLIRTGTKHSSPLEIGRRVLSLSPGKSRGLNALHHLSLKELMRLDGVGTVKAVQLKCVAELSRRMSLEKTAPSERFHKACDIAEHYMELLRHEEKEKVILISLNTTCMLLDESVISIGTVNQALLSPREVFRQALRVGAVMIILVHNHPGGDPTPSNADIAVTNTMLVAGKAIGIRLADHIIIGDRTYTSFREQGLLKED